MENKSILTVYACGGAGINIGSQLESFRNYSEAGFASINIVYIDTSKSNLTDKLPKDSLYIIEGLDGSGKRRAENVDAITKVSKEILLKYPPTDINIVLSSLAGGSGSTISPTLASELLSKDIPTIAMGIGSQDTRLELSNSIKTIMSFEAISKLREKPLSFLVEFNTKEIDRKAIDERIRTAIISLAALFSKQNKELDSKDLYHWLRYDKVTDFPAKLVQLHIESEEYAKNNKAVTDGLIFSVASLTHEGATSTLLDKVLDYQCVGYVNKEETPGLSKGVPIHFINVGDSLVNIKEELNKTFEAIEENKRAKLAALKEESIDLSQSTENGLIL